MLLSLLSTEQTNDLCFVKLKIKQFGSKKLMLYTLFNVLATTMITLEKRTEI